MALLKIVRGDEATLLKRPVSDGALLFATDTKKIYLDKGSNRVEMSSLQDLSDYVTNEELTEGLATKAPLSHSHTTAQVTGLDSALAGKAATGHTHAAATDVAAGFMSAADKEKLDGIVSGANKYTLPTATSSTLGGVKTGANITNSSGTISLTKANVTNALGYTPPTTDTNTWTAFKGASTSAAGTAGYVPAPTAGAANRYFRSDGTWTVPPDTNTNTTYTLTKSGSTITLTGSDGSKTSVTDANTTYSLSSFGVTATATELNYMDGVTSNVQTQLNGKAASSHSHSNATTSAAGFLPKLGGGTTNFLRADGTWAKPPDTNTTYSNMTGATSSAAGKAGLVPAPAAGAATRYLRSDGTWQVPPDTNTTYTLSSFGITATAAEINKLDGLTATTAELNYVDGVTGNIQTQLNGKAASSHTHKYAGSSSAGGAATSAAKLNGVALTNQDLNNYHNGVNFYYAAGGNSCTHKPSGVDNFGMFVFQSAGSWWTQLLYGSDDHLYMRRWASNSWTSWIEIYSSNNKPTASEIGAAASNHTHSNYLTTSGTAAAATKLATARTIALSGDVTGSASFNGTANATISAQIAANAVTANEIAVGAVGSSEIADNAVTAAEIATGAVGTTELASNAVTLAKLGSDVGTVAVQSSTPTDTNVKLWIQI